MDLVENDCAQARAQAMEAWHRVVAVLSESIHQDRLVRFWMNPIVEMSPLKSLIVEDLVKTEALRHHLLTNSFRCIVYSGSCRVRHQILKSLSHDLGLDYKVVRTRPWSSWPHSGIPSRVLAFVYLFRHLITRWPLRGVSNVQQSDLTVVSYFAHLDWESLGSGRFKSYQWSDLRDALPESTTVGWLHHFISRTGEISPRGAARSVNGLDQSHDGHSFLDSFITVGVVIRSFGRVGSRVFRPYGRRALGRAFSDEGLRPEWLVMRKQCVDGLVGVNFARNVLTDLLIQRAVRYAKKHSPALILWENQPWERCFISHWHREVRGEVLAYAHTTVPFWCLPYFDSFLGKLDPDYYQFVSADKYLVNGPLSYESFLGAGEPADRFCEVEAFRYTGLQSVRLMRRERQVSGVFEVLLVGEIRAEATAKMLRSVLEAVRLNPTPVRVVFKCHPALEVGFALDIDDTLVLASEPLEILLSKCDLVIGCAGTSALVEASAAGVPCASFLERGRLNFSSLLNFQNHQFLRTSADVLRFLQSSSASDHATISELFHLDPGFPRWRRQLAGIADSQVRSE